MQSKVIEHPSDDWSKEEVAKFFENGLGGNNKYTTDIYDYGLTGAML